MPLNSPLEPGRVRLEQGGAALAEHVAVAELVDRVLEVQPPQQRVGRDLGRAQDVAAAVGLHLGEREQLAHAPVQIAPHPAVHRPHHPVQIRGSHRGRLGFT